MFMDLKQIVERIGIIRTRANLSARALSLAIGKNASYIHLLESNKTTFEPSLSVLLDIIEACGSTPAEFFSEDINQYKLDKQTLDFLKTLSPYQKEAIMNLYKKWALNKTKKLANKLLVFIFLNFYISFFY